MIVKGEGQKGSKIWIIGEAPGAMEESQGRPFVGGSGMILDSILSSCKIKRGNCYVDNVIQKRPPGNNFGVFYADKSKKNPKEELINAHARIRNEIISHKPNIVVALGNESLFAITGNKGILKWRGSILNIRGVKVVPTIHPAMVMRDPKFRAIVDIDFRRIAEEAQTPEMPQRYSDAFKINPSFEETMRFLKIELPKKNVVAFDIETRPDIEQIVCIGFAWSKDDAFCIPIFFGQKSWWTVQEEIEIIKEVRKVFSLPSIKWVAQNAQYDLTYLLDKWKIPFPNLWMDTMIAFHTAYPEMRKSLAFLTSIYTYRPYYKDDGGQGRDPNQEWEYNCKDVCVTYESAMEIRKDLEELGTLDFYERHSNRLIAPMLNMQRRGVLIDAERKQSLESELSEMEIKLQSRLDLAVGRPLNVNSPKQVKEFLYEDLKLDPIKKWGTKDGKRAKVVSTNEEAIEELQRRTNNPVLSIILEIRGIRKLLGTYVRATLENNGRICCSYKIAGTETGRLSSSKSVYDRGTNLQNIPREPSIRSMFIPDKGFILINADLSQAEARVVAYVAREERMIAVFETGQDIHTMNAAIIFSCHYNQVTKEQRQIAKARVHGANYCIGYERAAKLAGTTVEKAREDLNKYKSTYPHLELWWLDVRDQLKSTRTMTNLFGRKRMFFGHWNEDLVREAIAYVPQSTVGDLLNYGIIRCQHAMPLNWELLMQNHDSVVAQVPENTDPLHISKFFKHYFEIPIKVDRREFTIPIDIKIGKNWGEMKDLKIGY